MVAAEKKKHQSQYGRQNQWIKTKILSESSGISLMGTENVEVEINLRLFLKINAIGFKIGFKKCLD